jgi:hypothetical protein
MATLTETSVRIVVEMVRDGADQHLAISGQSKDAAGNLLRSLGSQDVTPLLTTEQANAALLLLDAVEAYYKSVWEIS